MTNNNCSIPDDIRKDIDKTIQVSGAKILSFDKELKKIEENEKRIWKKLSFLL